MKQIKFRGQLPNGKLVYGDLVQWGGFESPRICSWDNGVIYDIDPESVAQFVGYDKDGREVYEGDTLTDGEGQFLIKLKPHGCKFLSEQDGRRNYSSLTFEMTGRNDIRNFSLEEGHHERTAPVDKPLISTNAALAILDKIDKLRRDNCKNHRNHGFEDYYLRTASAIIAQAGGFEDRTDWTRLLKDNPDSAFAKDYADEDFTGTF